MKIYELFESNTLPKDGKGNVVVWDPQRRIEVLVPEKEAAKLISRNQLVGGALNVSMPSRYPKAPSNFNSLRTDPDDQTPQTRGAVGNFVKGFKQGSKGVSNFVKDIEYSPLGQTARRIGQWTKKQNS